MTPRQITRLSRRLWAHLSPEARARLVRGVRDDVRSGRYSEPAMRRKWTTTVTALVWLGQAVMLTLAAAAGLWVLLLLALTGWLAVGDWRDARGAGAARRGMR